MSYNPYEPEPGLLNYSQNNSQNMYTTTGGQQQVTYSNTTNT